MESLRKLNPNPHIHPHFLCVVRSWATNHPHDYAQTMRRTVGVPLVFFAHSPGPAALSAHSHLSNHSPKGEPHIHIHMHLATSVSVVPVSHTCAHTQTYRRCTHAPTSMIHKQMQTRGQKDPHRRTHALAYTIVQKCMHKHTQF